MNVLACFLRDLKSSFVTSAANSATLVPSPLSFSSFLYHLIFVPSPPSQLCSSRIYSPHLFCNPLPHSQPNGLQVPSFTPTFAPWYHKTQCKCAMLQWMQGVGPNLSPGAESSVCKAEVMAFSETNLLCSEEAAQPDVADGKTAWLTYSPRPSLVCPYYKGYIHRCHLLSILIRSCCPWDDSRKAWQPGTGYCPAGRQKAAETGFFTTLCHLLAVTFAGSLGMQREHHLLALQLRVSREVFQAVSSSSSGSKSRQCVYAWCHSDVIQNNKGHWQAIYLTSLTNLLVSLKPFPQVFFQEARYDDIYL